MLVSLFRGENIQYLGKKPRELQQGQTLNFRILVGSAILLLRLFM